MNQNGFSFMGLTIFFLLLVGLGTYFSGIYQALVGLNIGDPIFFQILGAGMLLLAILALLH